MVRGIGRRDPKGDDWLIRDVSFVVNLGQRLALLGPTGAGKTVLLRALALLDPLDAGSIHWQGRAVAGDAVPAYRRQVIYLHQRPALLDGSVEENLRHPFTLKAHQGSRFDRARVLGLLEGLGRGAAFLGRSSRDLSGGEAQIVALLRAVQLDPAVLLLDEPTASLDQVTARAVEGLLDGWFAAGHGRRALVWVSHDLDQAHRVTAERLPMRSGAWKRRSDMNKPYLELSYLQVGLAALLILINGALSVLLKLGLERRLLLAAVCTVVQLLLIGLVLEWVFRVDRWYVVLALMLVMTLIAGVAATQRTQVRYPGIWVRSIASIWASSWLMAALALGVIVRVRPWYTPQYAIPLLGMILGNTLNGVSLGLDRLGGELTGRRDQVEALLALGATRWEAARPLVQQAVRTGLIPTINAMMVVGIVSLPGMMTGQILAGADPVEAVKYQIVIMFLHRVGSRPGHRLRRPAELPAALQRAPPVPECVDRRTKSGRGRPAMTSGESSVMANESGSVLMSLESVNCASDSGGNDFMANFTPTQGRYLAFIHAYTNLHGYPPAESEIAAALCVSPPSVNQMVKMLEKKGLILRQPGQPRSLQILVPEDEIPPWNSRKQATEPGASRQPTEPRCQWPRRRLRRTCTSFRSS